MKNLDDGERGAAKRSLAAEYATACVLADSGRLAEATPKILEAICTTLGWEHAALWRVDKEANVLRCVEVWHAPEVRFAEFEALSHQTRFPPGIGLPGRVWASGRPAWIPTSFATTISRGRQSPPGKVCAERSASRSCSARISSA